VVAVPDGGVKFSLDGNACTVEMRDVAVVDQPRWPALDSLATPARMSFKIIWKSNGQSARYEDAAIIGDEANGRYYDS